MDHTDVRDQASFRAFVASLRDELADPARRAEWENAELIGFLDAMAAWAADWKGPIDPNPWRHAAAVLAAARIYE